MIRRWSQASLFWRFSAITDSTAAPKNVLRHQLEGTQGTLIHRSIGTSPLTNTNTDTNNTQPPRAAARATTTTGNSNIEKTKEEGFKKDSSSGGHLRLRNLPKEGIAANDLRRIFARFGEIRSVKSMRPPESDQPKALIRFRKLEDAEKALEALTSIDGIVIGRSKTEPEKNWEGRVKRKDEEELLKSGSKIEEEGEVVAVVEDGEGEDLRRIKGELFDPTIAKFKRNEKGEGGRRNKDLFVVRNTENEQPAKNIRTFKEGEEGRTKMKVEKKDPLEGIDISNMSISEIRKLTLEKKREQREEHLANQKRVAEMKQKDMKDKRDERIADGTMKARSYVPRYKQADDKIARDVDSFPSLHQDQRTRRDASFGGKTFELKKRSSATGGNSDQKNNRREKNPENDRIKKLLRERVDAAKKLQMDGVELDYDIVKLEKDMQLRFGEYTNWPGGMNRKPWIFGEKDPNEGLSPGEYLDTKKDFLMEKLNLTSTSQYESLKQESLEEFGKMLVKEKYRKESSGESTATDVFEHRRMIFDMAKEAVNNDKNPLYNFAKRAASILDSNPGISFGKKKKIFARLGIDAKQYDKFVE